MRRQQVMFSAILFVLFFGHFALAQTDDLVTLTVDGTVKAESAVEASRELVQMLQAQVARRQIIEMIGEKNYQRSKSLIENRIVKESFKFIPFATPATPVKRADGWHGDVEMKVSVSSLRQMIIANGLLYSAEGPASILPLVTIIDRINQRQWQWWRAAKEDPSQKFLVQVTQNLHQALFAEMSRQGFYVFRPLTSSLISVLRETMSAERMRPEDLRFWADFYEVPMVIKGDIRLRESNELTGGFQIAVKLEAVQINNQREIAEVARTFEVERGAFEPSVRGRLVTVLPEVAKDLAVQMLDAWQKGTLGSNVLRLALRGRLNPKQVGDFKSSVQKAMHEIKSVRERMIEPGGITFEVDFTGGAQQFAERLKGISIPGFQVRMASSNDSGVVLDVKAH